MSGEKLDLFFDDPDVTLFRPRTAIATTGAFKMQSTSIPFVIISLQSSVLKIKPQIF